ncbi:MAG: tRNA (uracil-5-)-methyltransferase [Oleibacter sp.]|nr:tRNA (uracil-5-)-methyltransferase [Thalassolituus sp.]
MTDSNIKVVDFQVASEKHREEKKHQEKEAKVDSLRARFAEALPDKKTPVKDYFKKKRSNKTKNKK